MSRWGSPAGRRLLALIFIQALALLGPGFQAFGNGTIKYHEGDLAYYFAASAPVFAGHVCRIAILTWLIPRCPCCRFCCRICSRSPARSD